MPKKSMTYLLANTYIVNQFLLLKQTFRKIAQLSEIIPNTRWSYHPD